jgi:hypothetical protein
VAALSASVGDLSREIAETIRAEEAKKKVTSGDKRILDCSLKQKNTARRAGVLPRV